MECIYLANNKVCNGSGALRAAGEWLRHSIRPLCSRTRPLKTALCALDMNRLIAIVFVLVSCSSKEHGYLWFENIWISDTDASIAINPDYGELNQDSIAVIREMYGKIRWGIDGDVFRFYDDRYDQIVEFELIYSIAPIDTDRFQMEYEDESRIVWKTETGFCTVLSPDHLSRLRIENENAGLECFRPAGT